MGVHLRLQAPSMGNVPSSSQGEIDRIGLDAIGFPFSSSA